jgi:uncharacterized protein YutE (UPF0331/DUF86 family)
MLNRILIEKKLKKIEDYLRELGTVTVPDYESFIHDIIVKRFIERNIELSIEQMIDICKHIVSGLDLKEPETYSQCFSILYQKGILPEDHTEIFRSMIRYRNLLIHIYDEVDDSVTWSIFSKHLADFTLFIDDIRHYLEGDIIQT